MFLPRVGTALMPQTRHRSPSPLGAHSPLCGHFSPGGSVSVEHGLSDRRTRLASPAARGTWPCPRVCHPVRKRLGPQGTVRDEGGLLGRKPRVRLHHVTRCQRGDGLAKAAQGWTGPASLGAPVTPPAARPAPRPRLSVFFTGLNQISVSESHCPMLHTFSVE